MDSRVPRFFYGMQNAFTGVQGLRVEDKLSVKATFR